MESPADRRFGIEGTCVPSAREMVAERKMRDGIPSVYRRGDRRDIRLMPTIAIPREVKKLIKS